MADDIPVKDEILFYQAEGGQVKPDVLPENETVWLRQHIMADLFQPTIQSLVFICTKSIAQTGIHERLGAKAG
ncbi:MAG: hypothetical protein M0Q23_06715 [Syntrophales bacterium]|jgi:hypothetical protein|nr:hypothetical protein [Syntrophales bacterium]MCK9528318.1 hypothetical protein [Syntrophales bacterium]MDX9922157.1 hypothetical protein [Syntrophales bacterium]